MNVIRVDPSLFCDDGRRDFRRKNGGGTKVQQTGEMEGGRKSNPDNHNMVHNIIA